MTDAWRRLFLCAVIYFYIFCFYKIALEVEAMAQTSSSATAQKILPIKKKITRMRWTEGEPEEITYFLKALLSATKEGDFVRFLSVCHMSLQQKLSKERFMASSQRLRNVLSVDYDLSYFGYLRKKGQQIYFWRMRMGAEDGDDFLVELSVFEDKVTSFHIR